VVKQTDRIEMKLDKLDEQIKVLDKRLDSVDITLAKQQVSLDEHIKRTTLLENKVIPLEKAHAIGKAIMLISTGGVTLVTLIYNIYKILFP